MKKQFSKKLAFAAIGTALVITACNKSPYPGYELEENGVYTKFYKQDKEGVKPKEGDVVKLIMSYKKVPSIGFSPYSNPSRTVTMLSPDTVSKNARNNSPDIDNSSINAGEPSLKTMAVGILMSPSLI